MKMLITSIAVTCSLAAGGSSLGDMRDVAAAARAAWTTAAIQDKACVDSVYASPEFVQLLPHLPRYMPRATDEQRADTTLATDHEIQAFQSTEPRIKACRTAFVETLAPTHPMFIAILSSRVAKKAAEADALIQKKQSWGQYVTNFIAIDAQADLDMHAVNEQLAHNLARDAAVRENAAAAAYAREMQSVNSGARTPRPAVIGCTQIGTGCEPN
jgi:hypothetical protein